MANVNPGWKESTHMPMRIAQRKHRTKTVTIEYDGDTCDVVYRPATITPRFMREFQHGVSDIERDRLTEAIQQAVVSWDVLDEHDQPLPPTPEVTADFELPFLNAVLIGCIKDMQPSPTSASD